jgi:preprotein translocase subunit SecG
MAESYWSKNKGRSMEGALEHFTRYGAIVFMIITLILNIILKVQG